MRRFANDAVAQGFEGILIKDLDAPYECRRSSFWLKWKPFLSVDLSIVAFEEGTGKNTNTEAFKSVDDYIRVLKSLTLGMERVKADNEKLRQSEFVVAARREGIEPDNSIIEDQKSN
jgi:hypothetical protein